MFTFGRDHEKECAVRYLCKPEEAQRICAVVDAVHDVIDGGASMESVRPTFIQSFSEGAGGVWEQTGSWLLKLSIEYPEFQSIWHDLAKSSLGRVRFRVACFINELPPAIAAEIGDQLKNDRHEKTREMAVGRLAMISGGLRKCD